MTPVGRTQAADTEGGPEMFSSDLLGLTNGVAKKQLSRAQEAANSFKTVRREHERVSLPVRFLQPLWHVTPAA